WLHIPQKWMSEFGTGGYLFLGLRSLLGVTEADQGKTATIAGSIVNKEPKRRSGLIEGPGINDFVKTGNTDQKKGSSCAKRSEEATKNCCIIMHLLPGDNSIALKM
ncbi:hypothetical protein, partial [Flavitalea sp.]|nr:hypothetical protein [Flavitalea sp.]